MSGPAAFVGAKSSGKQHENFRAMLGDYLAIVTDKVTIYYNDGRWITMHGSLTENEMLIPLIVFERLSAIFNEGV